jgi:nucleotide-binding universal stress UspA family protein
MLPIHTILHPTDFSERSQCALRLAAALARDYGARLIVLHVTAPPVAVYGEVAVLPAGDEDNTRLEGELRQIRVPDRNVRLEHQLQTGDPVTEILAVAESASADLIVMGTHGRTGLARLLMGSVAEHVLRQARCPVLTVRTPFLERLAAEQPEAETAKI